MFSRLLGTAPRARAEDLDARSRANRQNAQRGAALVKSGEAQDNIASTVAAGSALSAVPLALAFPPTLMLTLPALSAAASVAEAGHERARLGRALAEHSAYKVDVADLAPFCADAAQVLEQLVGLGIIQHHRADPRVANVANDFLSVSPNINIAKALREPIFAELDESSRHGIVVALQKIVEMAPVVAASNEAEAQLKTAIAKGNTDDAKKFSGQIIKLRQMWASDGTEAVAHDTSFDGNDSQRMVADLRKKLGAELSKPGLHDNFKIKQLRQDIASLESWAAAEVQPDLIEF